MLTSFQIIYTVSSNLLLTLGMKSYRKVGHDFKMTTKSIFLEKAQSSLYDYQVQAFLTDPNLSN